MEESSSEVVDTNPILDCQGIGRDRWSRKALLAKYANGSNFAKVVIINTNPNVGIDGERRLGLNDVGIVVLEVYNVVPNIGDTCLNWPICQFFYEGETRYVSVHNHRRKRDDIYKEVEGNHKTKGKRKYHSEKRVRATFLVDNRIIFFVKSIHIRSILTRVP